MEPQTHRVPDHDLRFVDHTHQVNDGQGRVEDVGTEQILVEGDPLAAQTPVRTGMQ